MTAKMAKLSSKERQALRDRYRQTSAPSPGLRG